MKKIEAIKFIYNHLHDFQGGLPRAVAIYNYLSNFGELELSETTIKNYLLTI